MATTRILCLHGYHGSAAVLRSQMRPLVEGLDRAVEFVHVDAPSRATGDFGWWHRDFEGWERTRDWAAALLAREAFAGVFGFSQGAALASLLVGMVPFDFAVMVGGFRSDSPLHAHLYAATDRYRMPSFHVVGQADRVVPDRDSLRLAAQFTAPTVVRHPGGHVIPGTREVRAAFAAFLARVVTPAAKPSSAG